MRSPKMDGLTRALPADASHPVQPLAAALLGLALLGVWTPALAVLPQSNQPLPVRPAGAAPGVQTPAAAQPVERLMIQYKEVGIGAAANPYADPAATSQSAGQDAQVRAAALVARSAGQAQAPGLRYLRSVAPQLHVARLDRPMSADQARDLVERLRADPAVAAVEIDRRVRAHAVTEPFFSNAADRHFQWHLQSAAVAPGGINAAAAWPLSTGSGVVVAVLDGGYRPHRDLVGNLLTPGYDFVRSDGDGGFWNTNDGNGPDADAQDPGDWITVDDASRCTIEPPGSSTWHGTHVAGLVAALANNSEGVGVAHGARVLPVRVLGRCGGFISDVLAGMRWAAGLSVVPGAQLLSPAARVLNLSLGVSSTCDRISQSVVDEVRAQGVSIVASAGNERLTAITAPANCKGVLAVTAHGRDGSIASYANVGPGVAISAPGGEDAGLVMSTSNDGLRVPRNDVYSGLRGTSMSTPLVAGTLALMASARPELPMVGLEAIMRGAARAFPAGDYCSGNPLECGSGQLDAGAAVTAALAASANLPELEVMQRVVSGGACQVLTYSIQVHNRGTGMATAVDLSAVVSGGLVLQSVTSSQPATSVFNDAGRLRVQLPQLAPNAVAVITVTARVTATGGEVFSDAEVTTSGLELSNLNNRDTLALGAQEAQAAAAECSAGAGGGGGGCTVAPPGARADLGLPLLLLISVVVLLQRKLRRRS